MRFLKSTFVLFSIFYAVGVSAHQDNDEADSQTACSGGYSNSFRLAGKVQNRKTFTAPVLNLYRSSKQTVAYYSGKQGLVSESYIGVPLIDLLNEAGIQLDNVHKNDILRKYVVVTGSDCYESVLSLAELLPDVGGSAQVFVAYATGDGRPLSVTEGMARLIVPGDIKGGRYVSNISRITVRSAP